MPSKNAPVNTKIKFQRINVEIKQEVSMNRLKEIETLEQEIQSRILDRHYADSWEQAAQISADFKKKEAELAKLKKKARQ